MDFEAVFWEYWTVVENSWGWFLVGAVVLYLLILLIRFVLADCDLSLQWADKFGKKPATLVRKVVWVTGASSGVGEYLAYELAKAGCRLILTARRERELHRVKTNCLSHGTLNENDIMVLPLDVLDYDRHKSAVDQILSRFKQIDILVNNAGRSQRALWEKIDLAVDREMMELNVFSVLSLTRLVLPSMLERGEGHIVVVSSIAGKIGLPGSGSYCGSKHALQGYFDGLRTEMYGRNIKVTVICPGPIFSNFLNVAMTEKPGENFGGEMNPNERRMPTARCARLCAVAIANQLKEVIIALQPVLALTLLRQYCPVVAVWAADRAGMKAINKMREGR